MSSLRETTPRDQYRLTLVCDGPDDLGGTLLIAGCHRHGDFDHSLYSDKNEGLGPSITKAIGFIDSLRSMDEIPPALTCYVQDDVVFSDGWLEKLCGKFLQLERPLNLGFASGHGAVEHYDDPRAQRKDLGGGMYTSRYIRATNMIARQEYWKSMLPIPKIDPETGQIRGRPHDGIGSGVDWHFVRVHPNSVVRTGRTNLVMPGLVVHGGYKDSTWLKRELPESEADKASLAELDPYRKRETNIRISRECETCGKKMNLPVDSQTTECSRCLEGE